MKAAASKSFRDIAAHWRQAGRALDRVRRQELRNFKYEEHLPAIDALLQIACDRAVPRTTSGLVELQRLLARAAR
jgi:hypothetical protein